MQPVDVGQFIELLSAFWFKRLQNSDSARVWLDALCRLAEDSYLEMEQLRQSLAIVDCPIYIRHRYAYREPVWEVGQSVHSYWRYDADPALVVELPVYPDPASTRVFVGGFLIAPDDYVITDNCVTFVGEPVDTVTVIAHRYRTMCDNSDMPIAIGTDADANATETWLYRKNITALVTLTGTTITRSQAFPVGTVLEIQRGISPTIQTITVATATTSIDTGASLIGAAVYMVANFKLGTVTVNNNEITFSGNVPVGFTFTVMDNLHSEIVYVSGQTSTYRLTRSYTDAKVYYGSVRVDTPIIATTIQLPTDAEWRVALLYKEDHYHDVKTVIGVITTTIPGYNPEIYVDGKLIMSDEFTFDEDTGTIVIDVPDIEVTTEINIFYMVSDGQRHAHNMYWHSYETQYVPVPGMPYIAYGEGKNLTPSDIVFRNNIVVLSYELPYGTDLCFDVLYDTWAYKAYLGATDQLVAAESLRDGIDVYAHDLLPGEFSISENTLYADYPVYPAWFVEADFDEHTIYNVHGKLAGLADEASSESYRNQAVGLYYGLRSGRSKNSVENGANILLGAPYTLKSSRLGIIGQSTVDIIDEGRTVSIDPRLDVRLPDSETAPPLWSLEVRSLIGPLDNDVIATTDKKTSYKKLEGSYDLDEVAVYLAMAVIPSIMTIAAKGNIEDPRYFIHDATARFNDYELVGCRVDIKSGGTWYYDVARVAEIVSTRLIMLSKPFEQGPPTHYRIWYQVTESMSEWRRMDIETDIATTLPREVGLFVAPAGFASAQLGAYCEQMSPVGGRIVPVVTINNDTSNDFLFVGLSDSEFDLDETPACYIIGEPLGPLSS